MGWDEKRTKVRGMTRLKGQRGRKREGMMEGEERERRERL